MRIFVCHASEDKATVRQLVSRLRQDGFDPWLDEERLLPGHDWEFEIAAAVRESQIVLVCLSNKSVGKTGYLQKELKSVLDVAEYQPEGRIFVIPLRLEECPVPSRLSRWQYADLFLSEGYPRLREALRAKAEGRDRAAPLPKKPRTREHTVSLALVAAAALVIAAGVAWYWETQTRTTRALAPVRQPAAVGPETPPGMVRIPGGRFLMGRNGPADPEASPAHEVTVAPFYLDRAPVTNALFREFLRTSKRESQSSANRTEATRESWPVTRVTWDEADAFCLAQGKRLPGEAEWEFAARGTAGRLYPWGESFEAGAANCRESAVGHPEPVGRRAFNRSPYDVLDMSGNVWQWCADDYRRYPGHESGFPIPHGAKVIRGGSFQSDRLHVTAITRNLELPSTRSAGIGFRCAK